MEIICLKKPQSLEIYIYFKMQHKFHFVNALVSKGWFACKIQKL